MTNPPNQVNSFDNSGQTYFDSSDKNDENSAADRVENGCPGSKENPQRSTSDLLSKVLGETLAREHENPKLMLDALRQWKKGMSVNRFDREFCQKLISRILDYRLGGSAKALPDQLRREVGDVLWENPNARMRIEKLWDSISST